MEANEERKMGNGDGSEDAAGTGAGTGAGMETRAVVEMGTGTRMVTGAGTRTGSGRAEDRRRSARNRTRIVDAMWEMEVAWVRGTRKKRRQERVGSVATDSDNVKNRKKAGGEHKVHGAKIRTVQVESVCPLCHV